MSIFFILLGVFSTFSMGFGEELPVKHVTLAESIKDLTPLAKELTQQRKSADKVLLLKDQEIVKLFFENRAELEEALTKLPPERQLVVLSLIAIGEGDILFFDFEDVDHHWDLLNTLIDLLIDVENFYDSIGGIVGYHLAFIRLIEGNNGNHDPVVYEHPRSVDISEPSAVFDDLVASGIENLGRVAAIFPVGGAGDRLDLHDEETDLPLPAAKLKFMGRSLLNGMFRDLEGMEYLYYKLTGDRLTIPVALMTSVEKENDYHIRDICERNHWFHRDPGTVYIIKQPLAPVITKGGRWSFKAPLRLNLKPGGHGVIWKLAIDNGVFEALEALGIHKVFLRQVNNPMASIDGNILSLIGQGFRRNAAFGFMTCDRPVHISEGMVVLEHAANETFCLKNIEYTDFVKNGIDDRPREPGSPYSVFPSNTNILFADLDAVKGSIETNPLPGMLINLKAKFPTLDERGDIVEQSGGRLETVMQNVADHFILVSEGGLSEEEKGAMPAFSLFNKRQKTHSTTKRSYKEGMHLAQTPVQAFYDLQTTYRDLLSHDCRISVPEIGSFEEYLENGPGCVVDIHPALGPLFHVVGQKLRGGEMARGSELHLEISELDVENLRLSGSLRVIADDPLADQPGRCELINVSVQNEGAGFPEAEWCWKGYYLRKESLEIVLHGNGEFYAKDVTFQGAHHIEVDDGCRVVAHQEGDEVVLTVHPIHEPTWNWQYHLGSDRQVMCKRSPS